MPATVPEIIKIFYNCGGEWQTFACRLLTPINTGLPPSSEDLPLSCEGPPTSSVLLPPCCGVRRGTRKRRQQGGITALWDGRPALRDGRPTLRDGRPTLIPPSHWGGVLTARLRRRKMGPERAKVAISVV